MPGGAWDALENCRRHLDEIWGFAGRVRERLRPRKHHDVTDEERARSGRHVRVPADLQEHVKAARKTRPTFGMWVLWSVAAVYAAALMATLLLSKIHTATGKRHRWLGDVAESLAFIVAAPYVIVGLLIPVAVALFIVIAVKSSLQKPAMPHVEDSVRERKLHKRDSH